MRGTRRIKQWLALRRAGRLLVAAEQAIARFPVQAVRRPHGLAGELIVSLTSYPPRFSTLAPTLKSLLDQDVAADRTILWIAHADMAALPTEVLALERNGLEIRACDDTRSYKKLIPAMHAFPQATIVTADDDVYYAPDWLGSLVEAHRSGDGAIAAGRVHMARQDESGRLLPYREWQFNTRYRQDRSPGERLFPTGVGGVLYPPNALHPDVLNSELFMRLCPHGDDIWLFWMAERQGTPHRRTASTFRQVLWHGSQDVALCNENLDGPGNDQQIRAMEDYFGTLL